jgi:thiol-disulfide isomerase/thioredoxin
MPQMTVALRGMRPLEIMPICPLKPLGPAEHRNYVSHFRGSRMRAMIAHLVAAVTLALTVDFANGAPKKEVLPVGISAPPLHALTLDARPVPGWNALRGKVVVVDFWATWCPPCIAAFPKFNALVERYGPRGVQFYSITYEPADAVSSFLGKHPLLTTIAVDDDFRDFRAYNAWGIPVAYVFDRAGKLAGIMHPDELNNDVIDAVLAGRRPDAKPATPWSDPKGAEDYFRSLQKEMKKNAPSTSHSLNASPSIPSPPAQTSNNP